MIKLTEFKQLLYNIFFNTISELFATEFYKKEDISVALCNVIPVELDKMNDCPNDGYLLLKYWNEVQQYIKANPSYSYPDPLSDTRKLVTETIGAALCHQITKIGDWSSVQFSERGLDISMISTRAILIRDFLIRLIETDNLFI